MRVKDLKEILSNIDDSLEVYAFDKKVESYGIWNVETNNGVVTQFKLTSFKTKSRILIFLKKWIKIYYFKN